MNEKMKIESQIEKVNVAIPKIYDGKIMAAMFNVVSTSFDLQITEK